MKRKTKISNLRILIVFVSVVLICQFCSYLAIRYFKFEINSKLFFGSAGNNVSAILTSLLALFFLTIIFVGNRKFYLPLSIIMAAAISNQIDRQIMGGVIDYIRIFSFPIFNPADILIVIGFFLIVYRLVRTRISFVI